MTSASAPGGCYLDPQPWLCHTQHRVTCGEVTVSSSYRWGEPTAAKKHCKLPAGGCEALSPVFHPRALQPPQGDSRKGGGAGSAGTPRAGPKEPAHLCTLARKDSNLVEPSGNDSNPYLLSSGMPRNKNGGWVGCTVKIEKEHAFLVFRSPYPCPAGVCLALHALAMGLCLCVSCPLSYGFPTAPTSQEC